jgi:adenosylcobinamide kinase/adenosylcobinamide-phosphate guanylyltransferase
VLFIVGGAAAGKHAYVSSLGYDESQMADGVIDDSPVLLNLQDALAADPVQARDNIDSIVGRLQDKSVITCDEMGSGVIPLERGDRVLREAVGRIANELARNADTVVRVVCGIPVAIKGELPKAPSKRSSGQA